MAKYRKVLALMQNDAKFQRLSDDAQLIFLLLLTHPNLTSLGAMRASIPGLAAEKHWPVEKYSTAFAELTSQGMAEYDPNASYVALPNFLKHNVPENPNCVIGWTGALDLLPECQLRELLIDRAVLCVENKKPKFLEYLGEPFVNRQPKHSPTVSEKAPELHTERKRKNKPESDVPPEFRRWTDYWCKCWKTVHGDDYPFTTKDGVAAAEIWKHIDGNSDTAQFLCGAYFDNTEEFYAGHPLTKLNMDLPRFLAEASQRALTFDNEERSHDAGSDRSAGTTQEQPETADRPADGGGGEVQGPDLQLSIP
jgi:hypothetical protein